MDPPPKSILILGHGVFGLSTALSLSLRPHFKNTTITLLDRSPFPSPDGSSIDTSRIVRSDYSDPSYATLGAEAMTIWRSSSTSPLPTSTHGAVANILSGLGEEGRYTQSGLALLCNEESQGTGYVRKSFENMKNMSSSQNVQELGNREEINKAVNTGGRVGDWGYVNKSSGWADAEACMKFLHSKVKQLGRVKFVIGEVVSLIYAPSSSSSSKGEIKGVTLSTGQELRADLTILATGAWTPSLLDLRGTATATGQILCYLPLTYTQQEELSKMPVVLNMSTGMFIIPPPPPSESQSQQGVLKVARHGYGYTNPVFIPSSNLLGANGDKEKEVNISQPRTTWNDSTLTVPMEGQKACLDFLTQLIPSLVPSPSSSSTSTTTNLNPSNTKLLPPFTQTKICWYTDTPSGDFLITHHPSYTGLFLATGGSGHGFKFLPVIGERIVDCILKTGKGWSDFGPGSGSDEGMRENGKWGWREQKGGDMVETEDGSRGGQRGMVLDVELGRARVGESKL